MNWEQIKELCQTELQQLREQCPDLATLFEQPSHVAATFLAYERDTNDAIEIAVRQFAVTRAWPPMSPTERVMLSFRLDFAASIASLLAQQPEPWTDTDDPNQAECRIGWLMLFAWENEGFSTFHDNLCRLLPPPPP